METTLRPRPWRMLRVAAVAWLLVSAGGCRTPSGTSNDRRLLWTDRTVVGMRGGRAANPAAAAFPAWEDRLDGRSDEPSAGSLRQEPPTAAAPGPAAPDPATAGPAAGRLAVLAHGSRRAVIEGVVLWMSQPAALRADGVVAASPTDQRYSLDPLLLSWRGAGRPGRPLRVMLDPGHGGLDSGALTPCLRHRESALVLDIAQRAAVLLTDAGFAVRLTRDDDETTMSIDERVRQASRWQADLLVSVHLNSAANGQAGGLETYALPPRGMRATSQVDAAELSRDQQDRVDRGYAGHAQNEANVRLAFCIQRRVLQRTGYTDRGVRRARYAILRDATMPAVLVEAGFLSNRSDAALLLSRTGRDRVARGIAQGVVDFAHGALAAREER